MQQSVGRAPASGARRAPPRQPLGARAAALRSRLLTESVVLFASFFALYLAAGWYLAIWLQVYHWDTVARTALGYFVLYGREPKLASIGFIWPPLFSLLQLPLFPLLRVAGLVHLAGAMLAALFGAATVVVLNRVGEEAGVARAIRLPAVLLFGLHPTIVLYAGAGMTEVALCFFLVAAAAVLLRWVRSDQHHTLLMSVGVALALALLVRYESLPLLGAVYAIVVGVTLLRGGSSWAARRSALEAVSITLLLPGLYALAIWLGANWVIMGDPLYFYRGPYIQITASEQFQAPVEQVTGQLWGATLYALERIQAQFVLFLPLVAAGVAVAVWRRSLRPIIPLLLPLSLIAFHIYFRYSSYGWYRFYIYALPGAVVAAFWLLSYLRDRPALRRGFQAALIAGLALSTVTTTRAMAEPALGKEEWSFMRAITTGGAAPQDETRSFAVQRAVAAYIDDHVEGPILLDTVSGFAIVLFSERPHQFVITQNRDFEQALDDPVGHGIRWVLVPNKSTSAGYYELVLKTYPDLWDGGEPWATLEHDFGAWRLFRVTPGGAPATPAPPPAGDSAAAPAAAQPDAPPVTLDAAAPPAVSQPPDAAGKPGAAEPAAASAPPASSQGAAVGELAGAPAAAAPARLPRTAAGDGERRLLLGLAAASIAAGLVARRAARRRPMPWGISTTREVRRGAAPPEDL